MPISCSQWLILTLLTLDYWICLCTISSFKFDFENRPISQIPQCIRQISCNAPCCNRNVHMYTFLLQNVALWYMGLMHYGICEIGLFGLLAMRKLQKTSQTIEIRCQQINKQNQQYPFFHGLGVRLNKFC